MAIWHQPYTLEEINARGQGTMLDMLGIEFIDIDDTSLTATMPVDDRTRQPIGIMHGGASCVLAESAGSTAANLVIDLATHYCVGLSINTNHIRSIREGIVIGRATPRHLGRSTHVWQIDIEDEENRLISSTSLTMALLARR